MRAACVLGRLVGNVSNLRTTVKAARKLGKARSRALASETDEKDWIAESFQEAQSTVYTPPVGAGDGPFTLTTAYKKKAGNWRNNAWNWREHVWRIF